MNARPTLAPFHRRVPASAGFTLFESVLVILLLGILSAYVLPRAFNTSTMTLDAQARTLASDLQRAQLLAITSGNPVYFCVFASSAYLVQVGPYASGQVCPAALPTQVSSSQPVVVSLDNEASLSANPNPLNFNSQGQPSAAGGFLLADSVSHLSILVTTAAITGLTSISSP